MSAVPGAGVCLRRGDGGRGRDDIKSPNGGDQSWVLTGTRAAVVC